MGWCTTPRRTGPSTTTWISRTGRRGRSRCSTHCAGSLQLSHANSCRSGGHFRACVSAVGVNLVHDPGGRLFFGVSLGEVSTLTLRPGETPGHSRALSPTTLRRLRDNRTEPTALATTHDCPEPRAAVVTARSPPSHSVKTG